MEKEAKTGTKKGTKSMTSEEIKAIIESARRERVEERRPTTAEMRDMLHLALEQIDNNPDCGRHNAMALCADVSRRWFAQ